MVFNAYDVAHDNLTMQHPILKLGVKQKTVVCIWCFEESLAFKFVKIFYLLLLLLLIKKREVSTTQIIQLMHVNYLELHNVITI